MLIQRLYQVGGWVGGRVEILSVALAPFAIHLAAVFSWEHFLQCNISRDDRVALSTEPVNIWHRVAWYDVYGMR